ncbi:efflux RND transporter periplasmic adaptor subunit [Limnoraphis robusta]|uniref:Efflux RND transporter periplasmic adaptor subunit n=1 Tax=Limnoraphis robusta CCNP1315 TaxID=3110306 RepID=A0ABU5TSI1_9CYAN|nr:efflux RND transporter periplasmic adaptor subunit [Limnoraphis robusta]MEA5517677.1 efflux RND transporter periplasmic adaptor subunit [Limnoraphis robusta CCNP1315]MEA5548893.1 efflux RND transporter periplasmic adaptor subunit [Limnoraphis robusta CCNP1324]
MLSSPKKDTYERNGKGAIEPTVVEQQIPKKPKKHRFKGWLLGLLATGLLTVPLSFYLTQKQSQLKPELIESLTVPVETQDLTVRITASGVVQPVRRVNLSPKTQGRLSQLFVEQGDRVEAGDIIARMESREIEAQLLQAEAGLARVRANLSKLQTGSRPEEIAAAQARLNRAQATLDELLAGTRSEEIAVAQAKLNEAEARLADARSGSLDDEIAQAQSRLAANKAELELASERVRRYESLRNQGAVSEDSLEEYLQNERRLSALVEEAQRRIEQLEQSQLSQVDRLEATVDMERQALRQLQNGARPEEIAGAEAEVAEVQSNLNELINGTRPEEIAAAQAEVREAQAQVRYYETQLEDSNVRAPFSGVIAQRYAVEGSFVTPATSASDATSATSTSIVALAKDLEVLAKIPEADIGRIKPNQTVEIIADAYPDKLFEGRVQLIAPEAVKERDVTLFQARVEIITGKDLLQSGMNVDLKFIGDKLNNALVVPTVAIITNKGETGVLLPDEQNQPKFHPVTVGSTIGNQIQILEGIEAGDRVFLELPEGQKLEDIIK